MPMNPWSSPVASSSTSPGVKSPLLTSESSDDEGNSVTEPTRVLVADDDPDVRDLLERVGVPETP